MADFPHGLPLAAAGLMLAGCAATAPFSYLDGQRYYVTDMHTYPVIILGVDDRDYRINPVRIEPGLRTIRVQGPPARGFPYGEERTLVLDVKPCVRYYLKAVKESPLHQDFDVAVDYEEPIGGCPAAPD